MRKGHRQGTEGLARARGVWCPRLAGITINRDQWVLCDVSHPYSARFIIRRSWLVRIHGGLPRRCAGSIVGAVYCEVNSHGGMWSRQQRQWDSSTATPAPRSGGLTAPRHRNHSGGGVLLRLQPYSNYTGGILRTCASIQMYGLLPCRVG